MASAYRRSLRHSSMVFIPSLLMMCSSTIFKQTLVSAVPFFLFFFIGPIRFPEKVILSSIFFKYFWKFSNQIQHLCSLYSLGLPAANQCKKKFSVLARSFYYLTNIQQVIQDREPLSKPACSLRRSRPKHLCLNINVTMYMKDEYLHVWLGVLSVHRWWMHFPSFNIILFLVKCINLDPSTMTTSFIIWVITVSGVNCHYVG